ncbi:MAG: hypothetical protein ACC647_05465 [Anaerolineales bacterium]
MLTLTVGTVLVGAIMVAHGWWQVGVAEGKTTGWLAAIVGTILGVSVAFGTVKSPELGLLFALWAIYAFMVAGAGIQGHGTRALGFYGGFSSVAYLIYVIFFARDNDAMGTAVTGVLAGSFFLLFLYMAPPLRALARVVAWIFIIGGAAVSVIGFAELLGATF